MFFRLFYIIISMNPHKLPVYEQKEKIIKAIKENQVIVVESPTGSGKTTQLPLILYEAGFADSGVIGITQPRRIAAVSVCEYIAKQIKSQIPGIAGYKMRFEDKTDHSTKIKIMTDGILLQEMKADRFLSKYSVIIIDEAHERSLNIDFILGLLKQIMEERKDFKIIISSATINSEIFSEYFNEAPVVHIDTVIFPVAITYKPVPQENSEEAYYLKTSEIIETHLDEKRKGDILIFFPGEKMIKECITYLYTSAFKKKLLIIPLYGRLGKEEQEKVFLKTPRGKTKIVIATNIAETSITIDGITSVIDSGRAKLNYYNPRTYTSSLLEVPVSKASANQRKGRAGRTQPGNCYRLYSRSEFETRPLYTKEEIYRTDLSEVVLRMAEIGVTDFSDFDFISPPGREGLIGAVETLRLLEALDKERHLSKTGEMMIRFPLLPRLSRMIVESILKYPDVLEETIIATAFLSAHTPFILPPGEEMNARKAHHTFRDKNGDFISYLKLFRNFLTQQDKEKFCGNRYLDLKTMSEIVNIKLQLEEIVSEMGIPVSSGGSVADYLCAVSGGLIQFVCISTGRGVYRSLTANRISIHPGSAMFRETPQYIVAGEIVKTSRMFARSVSPLEKGWISKISQELADNFIYTERKKGHGARKDTTWQIRLGNKTFELIPYKGKKKIAVLDWNKLSPILRNITISDRNRYKGLKGKIVYKEYEILKGERVSNILKAAPYIDTESPFLSKKKRSRNFNSMEGSSELCRELKNILKLCPGKKKSKTLGFLGLYTDAAGHYWFKCHKVFNDAVSQSLASLETLVDELTEDMETENLDVVNRAYRRLSSIFEE